MEAAATEAIGAVTAVALGAKKQKQKEEDRAPGKQRPPISEDIPVGTPGASRTLGDSVGTTPPGPKSSDGVTDSTKKRRKERDATGKRKRRRAAAAERKRKDGAA